MAGNAQTTAQFTMPAVGATVVVSVTDTSWMSQTDPMRILIENAGHFDVNTIGGATSVTLRNLGYAGNQVPTTVIATGQEVVPSAITGSQQVNGVGGASPSTTKGDILVDNGGGSGVPNLVRVAVGTDGKALVADSSAGSGVAYATITPNTVTADNTIARYDGASGTPTPLQTSKVIITDNGCLQATGSGGNARGTDAIDLQVTRVGNGEVASGTNSVICGGAENTASGNYATVCGGTGNTASNTAASVLGGDSNTADGLATVVAGGDGNTASGDNAFVGGGNGNIATGDNSGVCCGNGNDVTGLNAFVGGGFDNEASGENSSVLSGKNNTASGENSSVLAGEKGLADKYGQISHASGFFAASGDAQTSELIFRNSTTDATPTVLYLDGGSGPERASISTSSSWVFRGLVVGRRSNGDTAGWEFTGVIHNNGGTTALTAAITATLIAADAGCAATWGVAASIAVTADNANDALQIEVTGTAGNNIQWVATVKTVETIY